MNPPDLVDRLPQTMAVIQDGMERKLHTGCQLYVSLAGSVMADVAVGESFPGHPMTADTINLWLSAGKPLTAAVILKEWQHGKLSLDDRVTKFLPEFAVGGKQSVTIRNILTHTAGIRSADAGWPDVSWDESIRRVCAAELEADWIVGRTAGYHTSSSWFILGEILARVAGIEYSQAMAEELFQPLGLNDTWAAISPEQQSNYGDRIGHMFARERGELQDLHWHDSLRCQRPSPGANTRGPIRELGHFYEMLLNRGMSRQGQLLSPQTVEAMTARHRVGQFDQTLAHLVDFGLGVIVDSNLYGVDTVPYGYGKYCSPRTFGHGGAQSSQGWCDPENQLVVAYFFNGRPGEGQHNRRCRQLNEAIFMDLQLA